MQKIFILGLLSIFSIALSSGVKGISGGKLIGETIKLNEPVTEGGMPVYQAMNQRKSQRNFKAGDEITLAQLSQLLWAGYGPNRPNQYKTAASNHANFGLDLYVFTADGVYKYLPDTTEIEVLSNDDLRGKTGNDAFVPNAAVDICVMGVLERESYVKEISVRKTIIRYDSGHAVMNMLLYCASEGLQCVPRANIAEKTILDIFGFDTDNYHVPVCFSAGP